MLVLETGMLGVFLALDFFLFYVFWEVMLVPMYFLIGVWGSDRRLYSAIKFFLYTLFGSVVMLLGILAIYFYAGAQTGTYTFDVLELMRVAYPNAPVFNLLGVSLQLPGSGLALLRPVLRHQGPDVPVPHLAARRPHRRARRPAP